MTSAASAGQASRPTRERAALPRRGREVIGRPGLGRRQRPHGDLERIWLVADARDRACTQLVVGQVVDTQSVPGHRSRGIVLCREVAFPKPGRRTLAYPSVGRSHRRPDLLSQPADALGPIGRLAPAFGARITRLSPSEGDQLGSPGGPRGRALPPRRPRVGAISQRRSPCHGRNDRLGRRHRVCSLRSHIY